MRDIFHQYNIGILFTVGTLPVEYDATEYAE